MLETLSDRLQQTLRFGTGKTLTLENMDDALKDVRRALLEADVSLRVVKEFIGRVREKAEGEAVLKSVNPGQQLVKVVHDELVHLLGETYAPLNLDEGSPNIIMMFGLQGSGKTTTSGKLARRLRKAGHNPLMIAADVYRPAAVDQLVALGKQLGIDTFSIAGSTDVQQIARQGLDKAKAEGFSHVIIDTAGRLQVDTDMMAELLLLERSFKPHEKLLVIDAMTGQEAIHVAEAFNTQLSVTGMVLTKLDGDTRGGAALSIKYTVGKPIKFVSMGEKMETLDVFYPERMAQRILGMGDIVSFVEKAQEQFDEKEAKRLEAKIRKNKFDFNDFLGQIKQIKKMGDIKSLMNMIPGMSKMTKNLEIDDKAFAKVEAIIFSMTPEERNKPELLNMSRKRRIAKGCGHNIHEINLFIKQFDQMRKMMHQLSKGKGMANMMGNMNQMRR